MVRFLPGCSRQYSTPDLWSFENPLSNLSQKDSSAIGSADENVLIVGRVGSGKTSGSGSYLAKKYLEAGFGAIMSADEAKQSA